MDLSAELRYYEIRFTKIINQFFRVYKLDKLLTFIEMVCFVSGADASQVKSALQKVLGNDPRVRINREEYLVCLKLFSGLNSSEIRKVAGCSPNTIINAMDSYTNGNLYIQPKFTLQESDELRKIVRGLTDIINIY